MGEEGEDRYNVKEGDRWGRLMSVVASFCHTNWNMDHVTGELLIARQGRLRWSQECGTRWRLLSLAACVCSLMCMAMVCTVCGLGWIASIKHRDVWSASVRLTKRALWPLGTASKVQSRRVDVLNRMSMPPCDAETKSAKASVWSRARLGDKSGQVLRLPRV